MCTTEEYIKYKMILNLRIVTDLGIIAYWLTYVLTVFSMAE